MEVYRAEQTAASSVLIAVCGRYISEKNTREDKTFMQKKKKKNLVTFLQDRHHKYITGIQRV